MFDSRSGWLGLGGDGWHWLLPARWLEAGRTVQGRILVALLAMSIVTTALGGYATLQIRTAGELVAKTFDQSLMSIGYARAAATDFASMRAAFARRWIVTDAEERRKLDATLTNLRQSLDDDLSIAAERSQSGSARRAAGQAMQAVADWDQLRSAAPDASSILAPWRHLDGLSARVEDEIELLVNYTAGDGFIFREHAKSLVAEAIRTHLLFTGLALLVSAFVTWRLTQLIVGPLSAASGAARQIAAGNLDCVIPPGRDDELGSLLLAMGGMRDNLRSMMAREVAQRRSAQARLADALESSKEGIVVVDAEARIALANAQLADFVGLPSERLQPGTPLSSLRSTSVLAALEEHECPHHGSSLAAVNERRLEDGRWVRISRNATQDGGFIAVFSNVTLFKTQEDVLRATNLRLDAALENMSQGLCLYDAEQRLQVVNRRFCELFRLDPSDVVPGLFLADVIKLKIAAGNYPNRTAAELLSERLAQTANAEGTLSYDELEDGRVVAIAHRSVADGGWVMTYEDVTERRRAEAEIVFMARHDALTRLPNRNVLAERIEQAVGSAARGEMFAVFRVDIDHLKAINDTFGHQAGDHVLLRVAERLEACRRDVDSLGRLESDEFAIVQRGIGRPEDAVLLARRIMACVAAPIEFDRKSLSAGVSIGIAVAPGDGMTSAKLLNKAEAALRRAKAEGRGTWRLFEPEMDAKLQARRSLEHDLRACFAAHQFELYYQPLYDLSAERICGFEALLRWNHPTRGFVPPSDFIPVAEEIGLIVPLGEWVAAEACREASHWPSHIKVAINVSPVQFKSPRLVRAIHDALEHSGLAPHRLELEITEAVLLADESSTRDVLHSLHGLGARIAMDDFGTGYSSLSYLRSFPFDKIKIDQSFIRDLGTKPDSDLIVRAIAGLGTSLGLRTTAEGVETAEQLAVLRLAGCNEAQGYFFSRPAPADKIPALLERLGSPMTVAA